MSRIYRGKPKARAARYAWDIFTRDIGAEPADMTFGYAEHYGNSWTATTRDSFIWIWQPTWAKASVAYDPTTRAIAIG